MNGRGGWELFHKTEVLTEVDFMTEAVAYDTLGHISISIGPAFSKTSDDEYPESKIFAFAQRLS